MAVDNDNDDIDFASLVVVVCFPANMLFCFVGCVFFSS